MGCTASYPPARGGLSELPGDIPAAVCVWGESRRASKSEPKWVHCALVRSAKPSPGIPKVQGVGLVRPDPVYINNGNKHLEPL